MTPQPILTNFNVPSSTRSKFDQICQMSGRTRTSVLVELMEDYVLTKGPAISDRILAIQNMNLTPYRTKRDHSPSPSQDSWESSPSAFWVSNGNGSL